MGSRRWSIRTRLVVAFVGVLIPYLGLVGIGMVALRVIWQSMAKIYDEVAVEQKSVSDLNRAMFLLEDSIRGHLVAGNPAPRPQLDQAVARYREAFARLEPTLFHDARERQLVTELRKHGPEIETLLREILAPSDAQRDRGALAAERALHQRMEQTAVRLDQIQAITIDEMGEELKSISRVIRRTALAGLAALVLSVAGGVAIALVSSTWLSRPILALAHGSRRMAEGDLSQRVEVDAGGELGEAVRAFNEMAARLEASTRENARLQESARRRAEQLATLNEITRTVTGVLSPTAVAKGVLVAAQTLISGSAGRLWEHRAEDGGFHVVASVGLSDADGGLAFGFSPGRGLIGIAAATRQLVVSQDVTRDPRFLSQAWATAEGLVSCIIVPLIYGDRVNGGLAIYTRTPHDFTDEEMGLLQSFATQAAIAIENARLHSAAVRRSEELGALLRATHTILAGLDLQGALDRIVAEAAQISGSPHVKVLLVDQTAEVLRVGTLRGTAMPLGFQLSLGTGLSGLVAKTGQPLFSEDAPNDPRNLLAQRDRELGIVTYLGLPIKIRDKVLGVLTFNTTVPRQYSPEELDILASFAAQAAIAIENARLYSEVQRQSTELEARVRERTAELEKALRVKAEFLATMSHELRTPLNAVLGFSELLLGRGSGDITPKQERFLQQIHGGGKRLLELVTDILDFSQVDAGKNPLHLEPIVLEQLLHEILELFRVPAGQKGLTLTTALEPGLPSVVADRAKLGQILTKLLDNAMKFTPDGGRITVRARRVTDDRRPETGSVAGPLSPVEYLELAVEDTGIGIKADDMDRIFRGFEQADSSDTRRYGGAGIGLALVRTLVELHGGRVWAESEGEGRGTRFIVRLPRLQAPQEQPG